MDIPGLRKSFLYSLLDIPGIRSPFFILISLTHTVTITASLQSGQHHIILTQFILMSVIDLFLVATGMIYTPEALAGIHFVVIPTSFPQGLPLVPLVRFTLVVTRSL